MNRTVICVDIDDTLLRFKEIPPGLQETGSLREVLIKAAIQKQGISPKIAEQYVLEVERTIDWWSWSDFIKPLGLDADTFWQFAYDYESRYLEPTEPRLEDELKRLRECGAQLYITSNNPQDGIKHKLKLAQVDDGIFDEILGATRIKAMKNNPAFWAEVIKYTGGNASCIITVGDNFRDDCLIPHEAGIKRCFLLNGDNRNKGIVFPGVTLINSFKEININE